MQSNQLHPITIEELMQHADAIYRYALSRVRDHHAAQDLVQICLTTAWQKRNTFHGESQLSTWLIGIMKFKVIDHFRRTKRSPTDQTAERLEDGMDPLESAFDRRGSWRIDPNHALSMLESPPDEGAYQSEIAKWIRSCMDKLSERQRLIFTLREIDGLDVSATAAAAGVTVGSAAVLLTRTRQSLRLCLQQQGIEA